MINFPESLLEQLCCAGNFDANAFLEAHEPKHLLTSIRLNSFKPVAPDFEVNDPVAWYPDAFYLNNRPYFTHDPLFHAGAYYVQEAGSMFIGHALKQLLNLSESIIVLDACAAPGGKSTLLNSLLNESSLLVSNEVVKSRADILTQNLSRWGTANTLVTNNYPEKFTQLTHLFDAIVVDAPCSGSGLFRKQPEAINEWSPQAVSACELRQKNILTALLPALKRDGILVYSTCSFSAEENEAVVQWLMQEHRMEICPVYCNAIWGIVSSEFGYRFYPHLTKSEGFFCCMLRKTEGDGSHSKSNKLAQTLTKNEAEMCRPFVHEKNNKLHQINGRIHLLNEAALTFLNKYDKHFYFKKAGVLIGELKNKDFVPHQELAWSINRQSDVFTIELSRENALRYLKKENPELVNQSKGLVLFTYKKLGLGWAKILDNRINNYLPNELKILR